MDYEKLIDDCSCVYSRIADEESRIIFKERILFSLTEDVSHLNKIFDLNPCGKGLSDFIDTNDNIYIFGAGVRGRRIVEFTHHSSHIKGFIDNNKSKIGNSFQGYPVYTADEILDESFCGKIIVSVKFGYDDIIRQINALGVENDCIFNLSVMLEKLNNEQYFSLEELPHSENEIFCDVGCFDGFSSLQFINWSRNYSRIYCFEPDEVNYIKAQNNLINQANITLIKKGVWSEDTVLKFNSTGDIGASVSEDGSISVPVTTLDSVVGDKKVTFIKMDIEGSEYQALLGAENTIIKNKPKLAICVYHKPEDIFELTELILRFVPEYKFYLRHYTISDKDTVLYAFV